MKSTELIPIKLNMCDDLYKIMSNPSNRPTHVGNDGASHDSHSRAYKSPHARGE